jgi:RNA polymerase sigma factor (sigma-70 family)
MRETDLEQLYARMEKPLYNVVFRWSWNPEDAQDIVQEAFVRLWRMRQRVDMKTVEPLVYRIALNLASSRKRSASLWRRVSLEALRDTTAPATSAADSLSADEQRKLVRAAVDALPEDLRRVVLLCEYSELSYEEIATALSIPAGTVGSRKRLGRCRFTSLLLLNVMGPVRASPLLPDPPRPTARSASSLGVFRPSPFAQLLRNRG